MKRLALTLALLFVAPAQAQNVLFPANPGDMIVKGTVGAWRAVPGGTAGCVLMSQGPTAAPTWSCALPLSFQLPPMAPNTVVGNVTAAQAIPTAVNINQWLDTIGYDTLRTPTNGSVIYKEPATGTWQALTAPPHVGWVLTSAGTGQAPLWAATVVGSLPAIAQGDLLYGSATDTLAALAKSTTATRYLSNTGTSNNPAWAQINLADGVTGILPIVVQDNITRLGTLSNTLTIAPTANSLNKGFNITQTGPTSGSSVGPISFNETNATFNSTVTGSTDPHWQYGLWQTVVAGYRANLDVGGTNFSAEPAIALLGHARHTSPVGAGYVDVEGTTGVAWSQSTGASLWAHGLVGLGGAGTGANIAGVVGVFAEADIEGTAIVGERRGLSIDSEGSGRATGIDTAISLSMLQAGGSFKDFITWETGGGLLPQPIKSDGAFWKIEGDAAITLGDILRAPNATVTGNILNFQHVTLGGTGALVTTNNQNTATANFIVNNSGGASAFPVWVAQNGTGTGAFGIGGTGYTDIAILQNRAFVSGNSATVGTVVNNEGASPIILATSSTERARILTGLMVGTTTDKGAGTANVNTGIYLGGNLQADFRSVNSTLSLSAGALGLNLANSNTWTAAQNLTINQNSFTGGTVTNTSAGASALAVRLASNGTATSTSGIGGTGYTDIAIVQNRAFLNGNAATAGTALNNEGANPIVFGTSSTERARILSGLMVGTTTDPGAGIINVLTGFRIGNAATSGNVLRGDGTNFVSAQLGFSNLSGSVAASQMPALTGDVTTSAGAVATTLATVNANVGTFGSATQASQVTVNAKGLVTAAANVTVTPAVGSITGLGTGVATALGVNVGSAGAFTTFNGALGTPSSGTATNITGLPVSTGISGLGTGVATFLATPSSANLAAALTDETGSGKAVFDTSPTLVTPVLGAATATSINFGQTTLNNYTEGTWTPVVTTSGTVGTPAYNIQVASYERIGRTITARFTILLSGWTGSPTGSVSISGLPVTSTSTANDFGMCVAANYTVTGLAAGSTGIGGAINPSTTTIALKQWGSTGGTDVTAAQFGTTGLIAMVCHYRA